LGQTSGVHVHIALPLGWALFALREYDRANACFEEALVESRVTGDAHAVALAHQWLGRLHRIRGHVDEAVSSVRECLSLLRPLGDIRCVPLCLDDLAALLCDRARPVTVLRLYGAATALHELGGRPPRPAELELRERNLASLRQRLDPATFDAAWAEGRAMTLEQAVVYAVQDDGPVGGA
jgi:tetratricopeptide (TPR) repeat protein